MHEDDLLPIPKEINLIILDMTYDVTELFKDYASIMIDDVAGNLWFMKDRLQIDDAVRIEVGKTYDVEGIVQIQRMSKEESINMLSGFIF
jgi:hypothetical protein